MVLPILLSFPTVTWLKLHPWEARHKLVQQEWLEQLERDERDLREKLKQVERDLPDLPERLERLKLFQRS